MTAEQLGITLAMKAARKLAEPTTQDKLVKRLRAYPQLARLGWRQRGRLKSVIGSDAGANALMDQDEAGARVLSVMIASDVLKEPESARSRALADALITEFPACVTSPEQANFLAYQLRTLRQIQGAIGDRIGDVDQTVAHVGKSLSEVRRLLEVRDPARLDAEVLLSGPLEGLDLQPAYREVCQLSLADPATAAARLSLIVERIEANGYARLAGRFRRERADLLARAGDLVAAADAWLPLVDEFLTAGFGYGVDDAVGSWHVLATQQGAPGWLAERQNAARVLQGWLYGDFDAARVMEIALAAADLSDPAGPTWLAHAAEVCLVDKHPSLIVDARDRLLEAADTTDPTLRIRLKLAVADATGDESLWQQLLSDATPGAGRCSTEHAALIHARRARTLFWRGNLDQGMVEFQFAADLGSRAHRWRDAANWTGSARHILKQTGVINVGESDAIEQREAALRSAGPGTLLPFAYDPRQAALATLVQVEGLNDPAVRNTEYHLRRYMHRSIILGELNHERAAHLLLGLLRLRVKDVPSAVGHFITAGDEDEAGSAATKLDHYYDCYSEAASPALDTRAAALRVASREADLIPDDRVCRWARAALDESKKRIATSLGPNPCLNAYDVLEGLATRLPDELVVELLQEIDHLLPRTDATHQPMDKQIAGILTGLGRDNKTHRDAIADRIATAFEIADDIAGIIVRDARSLSAALAMVKDHLRALLTPTVGRRHAQVVNAALALVEIDDHCPELVEVVDDIVAKELENVRAANVEQLANMARCLPVERQVQLARHLAGVVVDVDSDEENRACYASACEIMGADLPDDVRNEMFDMLFPLRTFMSATSLSSPIQPAGTAGRTATKKLGNFLWVPLRLPPPEKGLLRRRILKALAVLATDHERQEHLWRAAQQLTVSGNRADIVGVGDVGYTLSKNGFAARLPWDAMACSSDAEMRCLAAALIPFMSKFDFERAANLARDAARSVRQELASSLREVGADIVGESDAEQFEAVVASLRADPSYRVRHQVTRLDTANS
jgi:hypothetical protein